MNQVRHIIRKDLRRLRLTLAAWCLFVLSKVLVETVGAGVAFEGFGPQFAIAQLSAVMTFIEVLFTALLISRLMHDEPLVSLDAFWITRPIERGSLLAAKLVLVTFFLLALPLAAELVVMATFGTRLPDLLEAIPAHVLPRLLWVSLLMAVAALTPTLIGYVLTIIGTVAAFTGAVFLVVVSMLMMGDESSGGGGLPDPTSGLMAKLVIVIATLTVVVYQYRHRRLRRALLLAGAGAVAVAVVPALWPWSLARPLAAEPSGVDVSAIAVDLDAAVPPRVEDVFGGRRRAAPKKDIAARVLITGVPRGMDVHHINARSTLTVPGLTLTSDLDRGSALVMSGRFGGRQSIEAALGDVRLLARAEPSDDRWVTLMRLEESDLARYAREAGRLTSTLKVYLNRSVLAATVPLADGSVGQAGSHRFQIVRVIRRATGCTVLLRITHVERLLSPPAYKLFTYLLRNMARREAVAGDSNPVLGAGMQIGSVGFWAVSVPFGSRSGFVLDELELQFPQRMLPNMPAPTIDAAWLAGTELAIVETRPTTTSVSRTITVEGFRIVPK